MKAFQQLCSYAASAALLARSVLGASSPFYEPNTGISFNALIINDGSTQGNFTVGYALPPNAMTVDATEFIGVIVGAVTNGGGWSGIAIGGVMTGNLLLMVWPYGGQILTSLRYAEGLASPDLYTTGGVTVSPLYTNINATHYTFVFRCQGCFSWNYEGEPGSTSTTDGYTLLGWCQNTESPPDPSNVNTTLAVEHDNGQSLDAVLVASAVNSQYSQWATKTVGGTKPTSTIKSTSTVTSKSTVTSTPVSSTASSAAASTTTTAAIVGTPAPSTTYDYIVVGGGAGGIPLAAKLAATGKSVLLLERGQASSYRFGGRDGVPWIAPQNLTRYDVPGLCNEIWVNSTGISCPDVGTMAGCVLGGGTAINAGLWWNPNPVDFDQNFPTGWKSSDLAPAISRVFSKIPGTYTPSLDGVLYNPTGYNLVGKALAAAGWANVSANSVPSQKNRTFSHTPYMFSHGERGGPMATYLVDATAKSNFKLMLNTMVTRLVRSGGHVTGVQIMATANSGYSGTINVTPITGRVILSAGAFGTPKILFRSGIGPADQLMIVNSSKSDAGSMIDSKSWITTPVGYNLDDHTNTDTVIQHPSVNFYDFYAAWTNPIAADASAYLNKRSGILAQAAPNIGPMFWEEITASDGSVRQLQWTARVEGPISGENNTMTLSQYLGRGKTSKGRATISPSLGMQVGTLPYLTTANDLAAVVQGITNIQNVLNKVSGLTWVSPAPGQSAADYVASVPITTSTRTANHWIGTAKLGTDDGRQNGGTAVVDTNTKVWGTDNLFVVDASIFPGMMSTNPSALIVSAAEHASDLIIALAANKANAKYAQCGGQSWTGSFTCATGTTCQVSNAYYSQCL
ncbi:hypothetical protein MMC25_000219 [Agyrium rufum]|nr:hypothetical protein [Agyrium rufum]